MAIHIEHRLGDAKVSDPGTGAEVSGLGTKAEERTSKAFYERIAFNAIPATYVNTDAHALTSFDGPDINKHS